MPSPRILIIKSRHIGDVLLTAPLVATLRLRHPHAHIAALVKPGTEAMLQDHPGLDELLLFPKRSHGEGLLTYFRRWSGWVLDLRRRRFDWCINTTEGDRGILTGFLAGAGRRTGVMRPKDRKAWRRLLLTEPLDLVPGTRHTVVRNLDLLDSAGPVSRRVELAFGPDDRQRVEQLLTAAGWDGTSPLVQVHPTSRWFFKCWTDAGMARAIDHLQERGLTVVLTSAPDRRELDKAAAIRALCRRPPIDLGGKLTLKQNAALTARCRLFFGVDTAPMHMAAALDVPVVAIFGPSGAFDWGPWPNHWAGETTPYPQRGGVQPSPPHVVIQKDWPCVPCGRDGCDGSKVSDCLERLAPEEVLPLLDAALALPGSPA